VSSSNNKGIGSNSGQVSKGTVQLSAEADGTRGALSLVLAVACGRSLAGRSSGLVVLIPMRAVTEVPSGVRDLESRVLGVAVCRGKQTGERDSRCEPPRHAVAVALASPAHLAYQGFLTARAFCGGHSSLQGPLELVATAVGSPVCSWVIAW